MFSGDYLELCLRGGGACETMASVNMTAFKPVRFSYGQIHFNGGLTGKPQPVISKTVRDSAGEDNTTFVKMSTGEQWLTCATTGQKRLSGGSFGRTSLLEDLRDKVKEYCDGDGPRSSGDTMPSDEYDPMMEVEQEQVDSESPIKTKAQGQKRMRYYRNAAKNSVATFPMPVRCPEEDPECTEVRNIRVHVMDRKVLWLHIDDVDWAVRYLYVQNLLKGVPLVSDDSTGPR